MPSIADDVQSISRRLREIKEEEEMGQAQDRVFDAWMALTGCEIDSVAALYNIIRLRGETDEMLRRRVLDYIRAKKL